LYKIIKEVNIKLLGVNLILEVVNYLLIEVAIDLDLGCNKIQCNLKEEKDYLW